MFSTSHALLAKEKFERTRENVNIVTLGGHQHGKTWLASELSRVLAAQEDGVTHKTAEMIDHSSSERENRNGQIFFTKFPPIKGFYFAAICLENIEFPTPLLI